MFDFLLLCEKRALKGMFILLHIQNYNKLKLIFKFFKLTGMRIIVTLVLAAFTSICAAQTTITNGGFELWGNTVPAFGFFPYLPEEYRENSKIFEVNGLSCRPCSKIGFEKCPKNHFRCMNDQDTEEIIKSLT